MLSNTINKGNIMFLTVNLFDYEYDTAELALKAAFNQHPKIKDIFDTAKYFAIEEITTSKIGDKTECVLFTIEYHFDGEFAK